MVADFLKHTPLSYWETAGSVIWSGDAAAELEPLRAFTHPALLLYSDADRTIAPASRDAWASLLASAEQRVAPGGHQLLLRTRFAPLASWLAAVTG